MIEVVEDALREMKVGILEHEEKEEEEEQEEKEGDSKKENLWLSPSFDVSASPWIIMWYYFFCISSSEIPSSEVKVDLGDTTKHRVFRFISNCFHLQQEMEEKNQVIHRLPADFFCSSPTTIHPFLFLQRFVAFGPSEVGDFFFPSFFYLHRLLQNARISIQDINFLSFFRLFASLFGVACKFHSDIFFQNGYMSKICGISLTEYNKLELRVLDLLNMDLRITTRECESFCEFFDLSIHGESVTMLEESVG